MLSVNHLWPGGSRSLTLIELLFPRGIAYFYQTYTGFFKLIHCRHKMYSEGGVISVTSRILVVDLLSRTFMCHVSLCLLGPLLTVAL